MPGKGAAPLALRSHENGRESTRVGAPRTRARRARPESTHCRSSTTINVGPCSAAAVSSPSVATPTANRSPAPGGPRASADESATACASGRASRWWSNGVSTSTSAEYGKLGLGLDAGGLEHRHRRRPWSTSARRSVVLPIPGSPTSKSAPPAPLRAEASAAASLRGLHLAADQHLFPKPRGFPPARARRRSAAGLAVEVRVLAGWLGTGGPPRESALPRRRDTQ